MKPDPHHDIRKIQMTGGSSYIVTLPKTWITAASLKKNDAVRLIVQSDGTLLITPQTTSKPQERKKTLHVDAINDPTHLLRFLVAAYIAGFDAIELKAKKEQPTFVWTVIRDFTHKTIGQEVVEETPTTILLKDLLNPAEMPFPSTIKRMHLIVKSMHEDAITALKNRDASLADDVIARDEDIDRLYWLIARQYNLMLANINLARKMGLSIQKAPHYVIMGKYIERIGDHATRIARNAKTIMCEDLPEETIASLSSSGNYSLTIFNDGIQAFFTADIRTINDTIDRVIKVRELCAPVHLGLDHHDADTVVALRRINESIRRLGEVSGDMCEQVLNYRIWEDSDNR